MPNISKNIIMSYLLAVLAIIFVGGLLLTYVRHQNTPAVLSPLYAFNTKETDDFEDVVQAVSESLDLSEEQEAEFSFTLRSILWDALNESLVEYLAEQFDWSRQNEEVFLTRAGELIEENILIENIFITHTYTAENENLAFIAADIAQSVVNQAQNNFSNFFDTRLDDISKKAANDLAHAGLPEGPETTGVFSENSQSPSLLPDLIPLPARDISIRDNGWQKQLAFSTTYYNVGSGQLELVGDPDMRGIAEDHSRDVFQRIYRADNTFYYELVGNFEWHQEHLHYHYSDFVDYVLEPVSTEGDPLQQQKSTYCVRDVSRLSVEEVPKVDARYKICSKELQGVSVGWGDTYFHTYGDQFFDITGLESGTYRLSFIVNPNNRLTESSTDNNTAFVILDIDTNNNTVQTIESSPKEPPKIEHVYEKQKL